MKNKKFARYAPFLLVAAVGLFYHLRMQPMGGDDVFFSQATEGTTLWAYLLHRYLNWTSRAVSELVLVNVIQIPLLWRAIDFLMFATLPLLFVGILLWEHSDANFRSVVAKDPLVNWCAAAAVLLFPFHDMGTAGWITTTVTHFWPLWGIFFLGVLVKKMLVGARIHTVEGIFGALVCIVTGSHEQYAVIQCVVLLLYGFYLWKEKKKPSNLPVLAALSAVNVISLAIILFCPGNAARNAVSIADLPIYAEFGFAEKLYLGLLSIERVFIGNADAVFFTVALLWTGLVCVKTRDYKKTLLSGLPFLILFGQTVVRTAYPGLAGLFVMPGEVLEWSWSELSTWLPMVYLAVTVAAMIYALYQLFGENLREYFYLLILLGMGFGAGMVLGFAATIYVSGERVYAPLYAILLFVTLLGIYRQRDTVQEKHNEMGAKLLGTLSAAMCVVNVIFVALSV